MIQLRTLIAVAALMGGAAAATPPPVPPPFAQTGADCARPQYASDTLVCGDAALRALDVEVAMLARTPPKLASGASWEDQTAWQRRRSLCAFKPDHRGCLVAAYTDRRAVLSASLAPANQTLRCDGIWRGRALTAAVSGQGVTIRENNLLMAVATPPTARWQPWLGWQQSGGRIRFKAQTGRPIRCRLDAGAQ